jgi:hypothetical protein
MSQTITVRLGKDLDAWLEHGAAKTGVPHGKIVRDQPPHDADSSRC